MKKINPFLVCILCLLISVSLSGCRFSSVIEELILDRYRAQEVIDNAVFEDETEAEEENEDIPELETEEEAEEELENAEEQEVYDETEENNDSASGESEMQGQGSSSENVPQNGGNGTVEGGAGTGNGTGNGTGAGTGSSAEPETQEPETQEPETQEPETQEPETQEPETQENGNTGGDMNNDNEGSNPEQGGSGTTNTIYGEDGTVQEVPKNVYGVAAIGSAAKAVLMIGGPECLKATSTDIVNNYSWVFGNIDADTPWQGDGMGGLTSAGLDSLLDNVDITVVIQMSGESALTEEQASALVAAGKTLFTIPYISSVENAAAAARMLGEVLGNGDNTGGRDAVGVANDYINWINNNCPLFSEPIYTLYVDGWDNSSYYVGGKSGTGVAKLKVFKYSNTQKDIISSMLKDSNIINASTLVDYYADQWVPFLPFKASFYSVDGQVASTPDFLAEIPGVNWYASDDEDSTENFDGSLCPGGANFPYIIAANQKVRNGLIASAVDSTNGAWYPYSYIKGAGGGIATYGFIGTDGMLYPTRIVNDMSDKILVNPQGLVSSWDDSCLESVLESVWAVTMFDCYDENGNYIETGVREAWAADSIWDFYYTFYGLDLSQEQLNQIMAGVE